MEFLKQMFTTVRGWILGAELDNPLIGLAAAFVVAVIGFITLRLVSIIASRMVARIEASEGNRIKPFRLQQQEILSAEEISGLLTIIVKAIRFVFSLAIIIVGVGLTSVSSRGRRIWPLRRSNSRSRPWRKPGKRLLRISRIFSSLL